MSWNALSARDKSAFMNVALRHGVTDLAAIKRAYDSLGGDNVMAGGGPAKTKEPPFSLAQRAAENRLRKAHLFDDGGDTGDDFESRLAKIDATDAIKMRTMRGIEALYDSSLPDAELSARELVNDKDSKSMYYPSELFLLDPDKQLTMMEGLGFIPGEPHDYGRVAAKVARSSNPDMPVYQRYPHDITRDKITPIGGGFRGETFDGVDRPWVFKTDNGWLIGPDGSPVYFDDPKVNNIITKTLGADDWTDKKGLIDAGDYPFVLYRDDDGNFYVNAWDVNNYSDPMSPRFQNYNWWQKAGAKTLDRMGNPFVQTLGYKSLPLDGYGYAEKGSGYILPNVTVTPGKKAHGGKLNRFDDGGDVIDWGNVDLKAIRDAYQQSQEDNVRTYTAVPASSMSYNEGNGLWWNKDTGTWHTQDSLTFPGGDISGVTVAHNRNTGKDFVVPTSQYVRPLNTQDYFDHTGSNALEFASLMTSPTNLFMPSHIAGAIWDTRDKLSGKNPNINLWDSWLHENRGIGRTGNPYLDAGLNLVGDIAGFNSKNALRRAVLDAERFAGSSLFSLSDALASKGKAYKEAADQLVHNYSRLSPKYHDSSIVRALGKSAYKGLKRVSSASNAARNATLKPGLYLMSKYNEARDPIARSALEEIFTQKQDYLSQLARSYGLDYAPGTSPYIMARDLPIDYSGKYFMRGPRGYDSGTYGSYRNVSDAPEESFIAINPTMSRVSDREFASLFKHEGTHAFDRSPSTRSFMYDVAKHEHPEFHVFPSRGVYRSDYMFALDGDHFWTPIDNMHRATHKVRDLYYPEEFSKKARSVMPVARGVRPRRIQSHSDVERNADLTEIRARFARKLGLDPMSPGFNEAFANEVQALPDKRFFILNPGSKPRFAVFDGIEDSYTQDWTDGLMQQYENFNGYAYTQQAFVRDFIDTMKDLLINYRANGGRLNKFDGLDNLDRPNQMATAFDDLVAARDRYAQTGDINTSWEPVDLNDVSITDNGFITREGRTGNSFVLPEATVIGQRPATPKQSVVARRNDGWESESLLDNLVDAAGSAVAPFLASLVGTAAAATPRKPFVVNKKQVAGQANEPAKEALHTVKSGENLSTIARNYGVDIGDIISSNGIANPDFIKPGQQLRIPGIGNRAMHTVKSGENLSGIAKKYGVSVDRIASINSIANPDFIKPGQELRIPNVNNDISRTLWTPKQIKEEEARINAGGNVAIIHNYHSNKGKGKVYVIDDKLHNKVHICKDGRVIKSYNGIHSWNAAEDDTMTITYVDKHGNIRDRAGNGMTPSGVFFLSRTNNYHGAPAFMRRTQEQVRNGSKKGVPNSIHLRTMKENAVTNGCTGMDAASLRDFASRVPDGTPCYILPANSDNKFFIRNGELQFHSSDTSKVPAYNVKTSTPIERITAKANGLSDTQRGVINGFSKGLIRHKSQLQRELGLNDDTYDRLAAIALGILGRESNFGEEHSAIGNFARAVTKKLNHDTSSPDYKSKYATYGANSDNNSIGLTQLRIAGLSDKERELFERFGVTKDSLVYNPELAAVATMIKLGYDYVNTGQNFDNTIAHWNGNRKGYVDQVKDIIDRRFEIYKKYGSK